MTEALLSGIDTVEQAPDQWYMSGPPTAAVMTGLDVLLTGIQIDLVVSSTNEGANIGAFTNISGTVGAAAEAIARGIPAIAFRQAMPSMAAMMAPMRRRAGSPSV